MLLQLIKDEETVSKHKDLIKRLRYLEFEFHTLTFKLNDFIAPYFEKKVIPSKENGYEDFLPKLQELLRDFSDAKLLTPYIEDVQGKYFKVLTKRGAREYIDYAFYTIINDIFKTAYTKIVQVASTAKRIIKDIEGFTDDFTEDSWDNVSDVGYLDFKSTVQSRIRFKIVGYELDWLGTLPILPPKLSKEGVTAFKVEIEYLLQYTTELKQVFKEVQYDLDDNADRVFHKTYNFNLADRMVDLLEHMDVNTLTGMSYDEPISYSHLERVIVARTYSDLLLRGIGKSKEKGQVHLDRIKYLQYFLEKELGHDNMNTRMHEIAIEEVQTRYANTLEDFEDFKTVEKEYFRQMEAFNFASEQADNTTDYTEILDPTQQRILALLSALYKEYGHAIYHNTRYLEYFASFRTRLSRFFIYQHPRLNVEKQTAIFPFHIDDGVIERYLVETTFKNAFNLLTVSDILGIADRKYRKSSETIKVLKSECGHAISSTELSALHLNN